MYTNSVINSEQAIKPYYYVRNGRLHVRYTVDRAMDLSEAETDRIKRELTEAGPQNKQEVLGKEWELLENMVERPVIQNGLDNIAERKRGK